METSQWRILIVDDEPDSLEIVNMVLSAAGAAVYVASNGKDALRVFEEEHPNIILTDLSMPEIDGWEFLKAIRGRDNGTKLPVIALTAHAMAGDREKVAKAGFDGYLSKPLKMFTLLADLSQCLRLFETNVHK